MNPVTGLARLAGRSLPSVHLGNFSSVTEVNKARPFKFHSGNRAGVFIWKHFYPVTEISVAKTEISVSGLARLLI